MDAGHYFDFNLSLFREYGKMYMANSWGRTIVHTMDSKNMQAVLSSCSFHLAVEPVRLDALEDLLGRGVFTTDGHTWKRSRDLISPIFTKAYILDLSSLELHVAKLLDLIPRDQCTMDLQPLLKRLFLYVTTNFVLGASNAHPNESRKSSKADSFVEAFESALRGVGIRMFFGKLRFMFGGDSEAKKACARVHAIVDEYIQDTHQDHQRPLGLDAEAYDPVRELTQSTSSRVDLRNQIRNVLLPGYDSTAIGSSDVFFQLARHPRVWGKLREKIMAIDLPITLELVTP